MAWCHNEMFAKSLNKWIPLPRETSDEHSFHELCELLDIYKKRHPEGNFQCVADITNDMGMYKGDILYQAL